MRKKKERGRVVREGKMREEGEERERGKCYKIYNGNKFCKIDILQRNSLFSKIEAP